MSSELFSYGLLLPQQLAFVLWFLCAWFGMLKRINISGRLKGCAACSLLFTQSRGSPRRAGVTQRGLQPRSGRATSKDEKAAQALFIFIVLVLMHCMSIISVSVASGSIYRMPINDHFLILFLVLCLKHLFTGELAKVPLPTEWAKHCIS